MHFSSTPRASWTQLSSVLDMDSTTIARRWRRLVSNGHSWVNAVAIGRTHIFGYLLIRTTQDSVADVGGELLRQLSCAYLLARTEGEYEYFVGVVAPTTRVWTPWCVSTLPPILEFCRSEAGSGG